jgi:hypothetical protein
MQELIYLQQDTIPSQQVEREQINTEVSAITQKKDSLVLKKIKPSGIVADSIIKKTKLIDSKLVAKDSIPKVNVSIYNPYVKVFNNNENFLIFNQLAELKQKQDLKTRTQNNLIQLKPDKKLTPEVRTHITSNWVFFIFMILIIVFIWIRIFYNKFFNYLTNAMISYQLSLKMYNEKNALLKRVSFILDILYHIILSFFLYESFTYLNIKPLTLTSFNLFLFILNVLILFTIARNVILNIFNKLFDTEYVISEYIHNNFIINKLLGIILFPVIIAFYYLPEKYAGIMFYVGLALICISLIMKILRGYHIIIRKDILFYYLILYLCTLEILPLFIGYKVFISLL